MCVLLLLLLLLLLLITGRTLGPRGRGGVEVEFIIVLGVTSLHGRGSSSARAVQCGSSSSGSSHNCSSCRKRQRRQHRVRALVKQRRQVMRLRVGQRLLLRVLMHMQLSPRAGSTNGSVVPLHCVGCD